MKLLLVDDEIVTIKGILKGVKWERLPFEKVLTATGAQEARELLCSEQIEIMLCDIEMPGESGLKLLEWIREQNMKTETVREKHLDSRYPEYGRQQLAGMKEQALVHEENLPDARRVVETVKKYIWEHFDDELSVQALAKQVYISADYLYRIFKKYENTTPVEYMTSSKMLYAAELLKNPDMSISHAAVLSGYSNYCYFSRVFKKYYGMTPSQYQREYGEKQEEMCDVSVSESESGLDEDRRTGI